MRICLCRYFYLASESLKAAKIFPMRLCSHNLALTISSVWLTAILSSMKLSFGCFAFIRLFRGHNECFVQIRVSKMRYMGTAMMHIAANKLVYPALIPLFPLKYFFGTYSSLICGMRWAWLRYARDALFPPWFSTWPFKLIKTYVYLKISEDSWNFCKHLRHKSESFIFTCWGSQLD